MTTEKKYRIVAPVGNVIVPKDSMTEKEVREFAPQIIGDEEMVATWKEKSEKDPIEDVLEWLRQAGFTVTES